MDLKGIELFDLNKISVFRYRFRGTKIPNPWAADEHLTADTVESPVR